MANTSALITKLEGQAWIRNADGNLQPLRVGMRIPLDAEIVTAAGSQLSLQGDEKGGVQVAENQQLKLADDLFVAVEPSEAALATQADADVNTLIAALNQGQDPLEELDPTAATLTGGEGAGSTYVRLANVIERTTPLALQYPRSLGSSTNDFISGGVVVEEEDVPPPQAAITSDAQAVDEAGLESESTSEITNGQLSFSASDGIKSIKIGDVSFTLAQLQGDVSLLSSVSTGEGTLKITGYVPGANNQTGTITYQYILNAAQTHDSGEDRNTLQDSIVVSVTGIAGVTGTGEIVITIVDDVAQANSDTGSVGAGVYTPVAVAASLGVLQNDVFGADGQAVGGGVVGVAKGATGADLQQAGTVGSVVEGAYGKLTLNADGSYSYARNVGTPGGVTDVFTYTIKDGDGDLSHATLSINIANSGITISDLALTGGDATVYESALASSRGVGESAGSGGGSAVAAGDFTITAPDGVKTLTIHGQNFIVNGVFTAGSVTTPQGNILNVTAFNAATGKVTYSYTLLDNEAHAGVQGNNGLLDNLVVTATDNDEQTQTGTLAINIVDDIPVAVSDIGSVVEGATLTVGVAGGVLANDKAGADGWDAGGGVVGVNNTTSGSVTIANGSGAYVIQGQYGQLTLNKDGSYTYQATAAVTSDKQDVFTYTVKDGDGDTTTAQLNITVNNVDQKPVINDIDHSVLESSRTEAKSNVVLTIDLSGSMAFESGVAGKTRLDLVKEAVAELLNSGSVNAVFITTFSSSGNATDNKALNGGQWYTAAQLQQAILDVNALTANGGTNYDGALTSVMNYVNAAGTFPAGAGKNVSVFMSDGEPVNGAVGTAKETAWINWLGSKNFSDAYAIGFGGLTATNANNLEPIAWKAGEVQGTNTTAAQDDHVILSDVTALKDALLQTVLSPGAVVTGDLKTEGGNTAGDGWGGAVVSVVTFGAQTHTFTSASDTFTFDLGAVGKVVVKGDGTYTFTANNTTDVNAALSAALTYTLKDVDGSVSNPASLVFTLTDRSEVSASDDPNAGQASVTFSTQTNVGDTAYYAQSFSTSATGAWAFNTSGGNNNKVVNQDQTFITASNQNATLNGNVAKWLVTSYAGSALDAQPQSSNSVLRLIDNNGNTSGDAQLITPQFTTTQAGQKFTFSMASGNYSSANDTVSWVLYKATTSGGVTTWAVVEQATLNTLLTSNAQGTGTGNIQTGELDLGATYRLAVTAHDGTSTGGNYYVNLDNFGLKNADTTSIVTTSVANASGNVLTNDAQGSEGASLYVGSTKVGVAGVDVVGSYGTLHLNADGSYTYTTKSPASGASYHETQKDVFEYHLTQADGDTATANLIITVNASGPGVLAGGATETPVVPTPLPGHEILASTGLDTLVGTGSDDLFTWKSGTQSAPVDVVKGFGTAGSDKLVLGDLLQGEEHTSDLSKFLHLETQAGTGGTVNTVIKVSTSGGLAADGSGYNQQIVVEGVNLTGASHDQNTMIKELIDQGKLKLDHG